MTSPFPGMDPYLEDTAIKTDFHHRLATEISNILSKNLPDRYYASIESRIVHRPPGNGELQIMLPDVAVQQSKSLSTPVSASFPVAIAESTIQQAPVEVLLEMEIPSKIYSVIIKSINDDQVVTNIELLSPSNKQPNTDGYESYRRKRRTLLYSSTHLLEIDFTRQGTRSHLATNLPKTPYLVLLSRANRRPHAEAWPIELSDTLPTIPVPLLNPDPDVFLPLQTIVTTIYAQARYALRINYQQPPPSPAFSKDEMALIEKWLAKH